MSNIIDFKKSHKRFTDALRYIMENEEKLKENSDKWSRIQKNFIEKFEEPLDKAWQALTAEERKRLAPIYLHHKAQSDPTAKKIIDTFDAKIINVEETRKR